jgi:hypothetical protein
MRLDYAGYMRWMNGLSESEYLNCIRREALTRLRYPETRAWELEFHLDLALAHTLEVWPDVTTTIHTDCGNRLTSGQGTWGRARLIEDAADKYLSYTAALDRHGDALRRHAPRLAGQVLQAAAQAAFMTGDRLVGLRRSLEALRLRRDPALLGLLSAGLIGPGTLARALTWWRRPRASSHEKPRADPE